MKRLLTILFLSSLFLTLFTPVSSASLDPNDYWSIFQTVSGVDLYQVKGTSTTNIWAQGLNNNNWKLYHYTGGSSWTEATPPATIAASAGAGETNMDVASSTKLFFDNTIGGSTCLLYDGDGSTWSTYTPATAVLHCGPIISTSTTNAWAYTVGGTTGAYVARFYQYTGTSGAWTLQQTISGLTSPIIPTDHQSGAFAISSSDIWMVTAQLAFHYDGTTWALSTSFNTLLHVGASFTTIWCASTSDCTVVQSNSDSGDVTTQIQHWGGTTWALETGSTIRATGVGGTSATNEYMGGGNTGSLSNIQHRSGTSSYESMSSPTTQPLFDVYLPDTTDGWMVGRAIILRLNVISNSLHPPDISSRTIDMTQFRLTVSQAQCNGDPVSFTILTPNAKGAGDTINITIMAGAPSNVNTAFDVVDSAAMNAYQTRLFWFKKAYPSGAYTAIAVYERPGIGAVDYVDQWSFDIPTNTCGVADTATLTSLLVSRSSDTNTYINGTGATSINHIDYVSGLVNTTCKNTITTGDCQGIKNAVIYRSGQTNGYINTTITLVNSILAFMGLHFPLTDSYVNRTDGHVLQTRDEQRLEWATDNETEQHADDLIARTTSLESNITTILSTVCKNNVFTGDCQGIKRAIYQNLTRIESTLNETEQHDDDIWAKIQTLETNITTNLNTVCRQTTVTTTDCQGLRVSLLSIQTEIDARMVNLRDEQRLEWATDNETEQHADDLIARTENLENNITSLACDCQEIKESLYQNLTRIESTLNETEQHDDDLIARTQNLENNLTTILNTVCKQTTSTSIDCQGLRTTILSIQSELDNRLNIVRDEQRIEWSTDNETEQHTDDLIARTTNLESNLTFKISEVKSLTILYGNEQRLMWSQENISFGDIDNHFHQTDSYINRTESNVMAFLINATFGNITNNLDLNDTQIQQDVLTVLNPLNDLFWLLLVITSLICLFYIPRFNGFVSMMFSLFAMFYAINNFAGIFRTIGVGVSVMIFGLDIWKSLQEKDGDKKNA